MTRAMQSISQLTTLRHCLPTAVTTYFRALADPIPGWLIGVCRSFSGATCLLRLKAGTHKPAQDHSGPIDQPRDGFGSDGRTHRRAWRGANRVASEMLHSQSGF